MEQQDDNIGKEENPMASLLDADLGMNQISRGDILEGKITSINHSEILVDVGSKSEGMITGKELEALDAKARSELNVGEDILVYVVNPEDENGNILIFRVDNIHQNVFAHVQLTAGLGIQGFQLLARDHAFTFRSHIHQDFRVIDAGDLAFEYISPRNLVHPQISVKEASHRVFFFPDVIVLLFH